MRTSTRSGSPSPGGLIALIALVVVGATLSAVASAQPAGAAFHDVTRGGNLFDNATPGWDYATGLGTPRRNAAGRRGRRQRQEPVARHEV